MRSDRLSKEAELNTLLPFVVGGISAGSIYGLTGSGLVLTYRTTGIFNFGYGAVATAAAYIFYSLHIVHGVPWGLAFAVAVAVAGPIMGLAMDQVAKRLAPQPTSTKIVGTIGLILLVQGVATAKYGSTPQLVGQYLPGAFSHFRVGGVNVGYPQLWVALVGAGGALLLYVLINRTHSGLVMRAVVDDPDLVAMQAINPNRARRLSWIIGTTFAALSGVLILPFIGLDSIALTFLVVQAFGAAAIGTFSSIPMTFMGGIGLGVLASVSTKYVLDVSWLAGLPSSLPFIVLFLVLLITPKRRLATAGVAVRRPRPTYRAPAPVRGVAAVLVLCALGAVPVVVGAARLGFFTVGLTQIILVLSLGLLVRTSGQVSLCHTAFAATGAVAFAQFTHNLSIPWFAAVLLAGAVVVPVGVLVAIPAIRLSGLYLALATFGFGILVERLLYGRTLMFTSASEGRQMPRPSIAQGDVAYYYVVLGFVVVIAAAMVAIHQSRLGRTLRGLADAPVAVTTLGLSSNTTRIVVFCISAFMAGISGVLYGSSVHFAVGTDTHYQAFYSLVLLAILAISPFGEPWYGLTAGVAAVIPAYLTSASTTSWLTVLFGGSAVAVSMKGGNPQMPPVLTRFLDRFARHDDERVPRRPAVLIRATAAVENTATRLPSGLSVSDLRVRFGGIVAVDGVSLAAPLGQITGLIGPNGAGKTTTFDACSGLNRRVSGIVRLGDHDITGLGPAARARLGLGRTFQRLQLGDSLTVFDNVSLGREAGLAGTGVGSQLAATMEQRRLIRRSTADALELCGIADLAEVPAGALSTGQRRLVELARCLAGPFQMLLLDEPSSGLDRTETAAFDAVLKAVVQERGCGVLLVEHDMSLVLSICSLVYVMDFGRMIFTGTPAELSASPTVQAAYLGAPIHSELALPDAAL